MTDSDRGRKETDPLHDLDDWDDDVRRRYPQPGPSADDLQPSEAAKNPAEFRNYAADTRPGVREFYRQNHRFQTVDFVRAKRAEYEPLNKRTMGIWEAMEYLEQLVDDSDPDTDVPQIEHAIQTAEDIRRDGHPDWFVVTGLIHDMGKVLCLFGEPQWCVVGDTFPVGCAFSDRIVFPEFFGDNPDSHIARYQTPCGIYSQGCGLDSVLMSWGHDEYLYHVVKDYLPEEALYMVRYHSFYPGHRDGAYAHLMNDHDREMFRWVKKFNPYDLYTKSHERPDVAGLRPLYKDLVAQFFPDTIRW